MSHRKNGLKMLGLLVVAALGIMAFAASAQALTPKFLINGQPLGSLHASASGVQEGTSTLLVPNLNLEINCTEFEVKEGLILNATDADAKLLYKGCTALELPAPIGKLEELPCHVSDVGGGSPSSLHVTTATALLLPIEFASGDYGILADVNEFFINFLSGTGCPLPLKNKISGKVCALIEPATNDTIEPLVLLSQAIQESCGDQLLYGTNTAYVDGAAKIFLTGTHVNLTLGVSLQ